MEKLIILTGGIVGTMRVRTEKQGTNLEIALRKGVAGSCTAYLVNGLGALCPIRLDAALKGGVDRPFDVHAVLLVSNGGPGVEFLAEGGFIGRSKLLEQAKRDVRILRAEASAKEISTAPMLKPEPEMKPEPAPPLAYRAESAAEAISEQARLTREYAGIVRAGEAQGKEGGKNAGTAAFRAPQEEKPNSRALEEILKKADVLFRPLDEQLKADAHKPAPENAVYNPFPDAFPAARWKKVNYPGTSRFYWEGEMEQNGSRMLLHALPGEYAPVPPMRRRGFTRFLRAADGNGYWVRMQRK